MNFSTLFKKTPFIANACRQIATLRRFEKHGLAFCCPFASTHSQRTTVEYSVLSLSSRFIKGVLTCRLSHVCSLVAFLSLLLTGLVLAQVSGHASSKDMEFKKERGWEENIISTTATPYRNDRIREERFRLKSEAYGLVHDRLRSEMPVDASSLVKPVAHMSMNICDRTALVMDAILSRIPATNDCSEVTSTQLAAITNTLDLSFKNISSLKAGDFDGLVSLTGLDLRHNHLSLLPDGIFDELTSLTGLWLRYNLLSTLPDGLFDKLTSLTGLDLGRNDLSKLPDGIFDVLTSLMELRLYYNELSTLPAGIFDELTLLTVLLLDENDLSTLPDGIFDELTSLTGLGLSGNDLATLSDGIFDELTSLTGLGLMGNELSTLPDGIFDELTSLTALRLLGNELSTLPDGIFDELTSLTHLDLEDNNLSTLPAGVFDALTSLTRFELGENDLSTLPDDIFSELTSLTLLDLKRNDLSTLPDGIFDELTLLTALRLEENDLSTLPSGIFDKLTLLKALSLEQNGLSTLPDGIFDELAKLSLRRRFSRLGLSLRANPGAPFSPVVNAGADLSVRPGAAVSISGSVKGPWEDFVRWDWTQVDGPDSDVPISGALPLTGGDTARPSFTAPTAEGELHFKLVVAPGQSGNPNESNGLAYSAPDWVTVTVSNAPTNTSEIHSVVDFNLLGNYPNPFNPSTTILLDVPQVAAVAVEVFNVLGQRVHREEFPAVAAGASKPLPLDVSHLSSGAYIYQVTARMGKEVHRASGCMTLIK